MNSVRILRTTALLLGTGTCLYVGKRYYIDSEDRLIDEWLDTHRKARSKWLHNWSEINNNFETRPLIENELSSNLTKNFYLVRHGQYDIKAEDAKNHKLTKKGWKQAQETGRKLKNSNIKFSVILHSELIRARQTLAAIMWEYSDEFRDFIVKKYKIANISTLPTKELTDFVESHFSTSFGSLPNSQAKELTSYKILSDSPFDYKVKPLVVQSSLLNEGRPIVLPTPYRLKRRPDPEELLINGSRIEAGFRTFFHRLSLYQWVPAELYQRAMKYYEASSSSENILIVGHANVIRYWITRAMQVGPEAWLRMSLQHGSLTVISVQRRSDSNCVVRIKCVGDASFLPNYLESS